MKHSEENSIKATADGLRAVNELSLRGGDDAAVRAEVRQVEAGSVDLALILHQEGLDRVPQTGAIAPSLGAVKMVELPHDFRPRLEQARMRYIADYLPSQR